MLKGKNAVVTGSTSGIGLGIAHALAAQGCGIMLNGFGDKASIDKIRKDFDAMHGIKSGYSGADMSKPGDIREMIQQAEKELGSVDVLVNNAGIQFTALVEEFPDDKWDAIIAINLCASFHTIKAALPGMKQRKWGRIINIASAHGLVASTHKVAYVSAKHGLVGMTKVVACEAANDGVTCNAICPGWVLTPLVDKQIHASANEKGTTYEKAKNELLSEKQPMLQFTTTDQIGALAVYLASDAASTVTGAAISIDGGWVAQ
ncbi:MAG TPA: 3-hydroxybutyrate dehydrogenase [Stellaceae bacterium]|nr:3-hydroxybutyrate dehydrogenase [Stellaceae bacterium]